MNMVFLNKENEFILSVLEMIYANKRRTKKYTNYQRTNKHKF